MAISFQDYFSGAKAAELQAVGFEKLSKGVNYQSKQNIIPFIKNNL